MCVCIHLVYTRVSGLTYVYRIVQLLELFDRISQYSSILLLIVLFGLPLIMLYRKK